MSDEHGGGAGSGTSQQLGARSRLTTFAPPRPNRLLIKALTPVVRRVCLTGVPGLRRVPLLNRLPGVSGLMKVEKLDFPAADKERLRKAVNSGTAAFLTPNHPEFFTDWMLDKMVMAEVAPLAACWATHTVVNGMGRAMQGFWLRNNLIAQIPGVGGRPGKDYSVAWAMQGHGVLLHPEGNVGWHGDHVATLFPGAVEMAMEAAERLQLEKINRRVLLAPVVWKLKFRQPVTAALQRELALVETALELPSGHRLANPAERLYRIFDGLLARDEVAHDIHPNRAPFVVRHARLVNQIGNELCDLLDRVGAEDVDMTPNFASTPAGGQPDMATCLRRADRWLRTERARAATGVEDNNHRHLDRIARCSADARRLMRFQSALYAGDELTEEQIAESIKRIRSDYLMHGTRHLLHKFLPVPVGPRIAHIRVPDPIEILPIDGERQQDLSGVTGLRTLIAADLRKRMQDSLDAINREIDGTGGAICHANPFKV